MALVSLIPLFRPDSEARCSCEVGDGEEPRAQGRAIFENYCQNS